jgi:hypothetical protein
MARPFKAHTITHEKLAFDQTILSGKWLLETRYWCDLSAV